MMKKVLEEILQKMEEEFDEVCEKVQQQDGS